MPHPNYAVIIPSHNAECTVKEAISSALLQTVPPAEILVICDNTTDSTETIVKESFSQIVRTINVDFGNSAKSRNFGVRNVKSQFIAFLDADDTWAPAKIEKQFLLLQSEQQEAIAATDSLYINKFGVVVGRNVRTHSDAEANGMLENGEGMPTLLSTWLMPTKVFKDLNGFDTNLPMSEDFDFAVRAVQSAIYFKIVREPLANYLLHDGSKTAKRKLLQNKVAKEVQKRSLNKETYDFSIPLSEKNSVLEYRDAFVDIQIRKFLISARPNKLKRNYFRLILPLMLNPKRLIGKFMKQRN